MEDYLVISARGPWYEIFYNLAFLIAFAVLLYEGFRREFPVLKWILLLVITRMLFITGTKIIALTVSDWNFFFSHGCLPETHDRMLAGGLLFGGAGLVAGFYLLKFRQNITDAFALVIPLGMTIQRMGCFLAGCCFGKTSALPWAVRYPVNTLPHYHQFNDGLLTHNDLLSLPVHPVQLYEMLLLLIAVFILLFLKNRIKRAGSFFILSLALLFTARFVSEFFRDTDAHTIGGSMFGVLNTTQLVLLPLTLLLFIFFRKREKALVSSVRFCSRNDIGLAPAFLSLTILFLLFRAAGTWFAFPEKIALGITFVVSYFILAYLLFRRFLHSPLRWLYLTGFFLPLLLMAQTFPFYEQDSVYVKKYKSLKVGFANGNFENSHDIGHGSGCDRVSQTEYFKQSYSLAGAALEFTEVNPVQKYQLSYGLKTMAGRHREIRISDNLTRDKTLFGLTPYGNLEMNWLGFGGGLHMGNLTYITENLSVEGSGRPKSGSKNTPVYPQLYLRFGPRRWIFADYHFADHFPSALPGFRQQLGIGTGLGMKNGTNLRVGFNTQDIYYTSGYFAIRDKIVLEPILLWGKLYRGELAEPQNHYQFSLGVSYRFGFKEEYSKVRDWIPEL